MQAALRELQAESARQFGEIERSAARRIAEEEQRITRTLDDREREGAVRLTELAQGIAGRARLATYALVVGLVAMVVAVVALVVGL